MPSVAALSALGRGRASVQEVEERSVDPSHPSPARNPDRSAYWVPGLPILTSIFGKPAQKKSPSVRGLHVPNGGLPESMIRPVPMIFFENIDVIA